MTHRGIGKTMDERYDIIPDRPKHIHFIRDDDKAKKAIAKLLTFDLLGFDLETFHAFDRDKPAFDPSNGARMRTAQWATPAGDVYVFDLYRVDKFLMRRMFPNKFLCVIQNAKFEYKYLMHELGIYSYGPMWDTMIAGQIINRGRVTGQDFVSVSLEALAERELGVSLPKDEQASQWYKVELSDSQIEYAARDAMVVLPLYQKQREKLKEQKQVRVAELEFATTPVLALMELNGLPLSIDKWNEVCAETEKEIDEISQELWKLLGTQNTLFDGVSTLNLDSKDQIKAAFERVGIKIPMHPETNVPTVSAKLLEDQRDRREVDLYIKYVGLSKRLTSYGRNWADKINPYTGHIHCQLKQIGAETGRMACGDPNLMQIPKQNKYRNCFEAPEGWVFIDNDYSQCELRILAEYCRDPNLLQAFDSDEDLHRYTAHLLYKVPLENVQDKERSISKNMNFLMVYGGGAKKLATQAGISEAIAEQTMDYYLRQVYPGMGQWLETQARNVLDGLRAYTMTGRTRQYIGDLSDKKLKSKFQRNAKNMPIQGTNADITKLALVFIYRKLVQYKLIEHIKLLVPIHDEILIMAKLAYVSIAQRLLTEAMLDAERQYLRRVPSKVDSVITRVWCKDPSPEHIEEAQKLINGVTQIELCEN